MCQVLPKQMCPPPKPASLQPCPQAVLPERGGGVKRPSTGCTAKAPRLPCLWPDRGHVTCLTKVRAGWRSAPGGTQQSAQVWRENTAVSAALRGPAAMCYPSQSMVLGVSPASSPPFTTGSGRKDEGIGKSGAEEFQLSLLFVGRTAEAGPSWGKVI